MGVAGSTLGRRLSLQLVDESLQFKKPIIFVVLPPADPHCCRRREQNLLVAAEMSINNSLVNSATYLNLFRLNLSGTVLADCTR